MSTAAFPLLSDPEFEAACQALLLRVQALESLQELGWLSIRFAKQTTGGSILKISKVFNCPSPSVSNREEEAKVRQETLNYQERDIDAFKEDEEEEEEEEDDPEALVRIADPDPGPPYFQVDYDILLSPTYQVPMLYIILRGSHLGSTGIDTVYQYLVPDQYKKELKSVGVMGGISLGNHPESGVPAFFVHPCNTAEAMCHIVAERQNVHPEIYLLIWLGLVGNCVSLHMPRELFAK